MAELWLSLAGIPAEGREFCFSDREIISHGLGELDPPPAALRAFEAKLFVSPRGAGVYVKGALEGSVGMPCCRCAEECDQPIAAEFSLYEELGGDEGVEGERSLLRETDGHLELDVAGLLWEEFVLALPDKPLCAEECRGICPTCGQNLNQAACDCPKDEGDPRMAVFKGLKIN